MNHNNRDKNTRKTDAGMPYWIIQFPFLPVRIVMKLFWYCSKNCSLTWSNKKDSCVDSTYNSTNAILCIGLAPWSVILTDASIIFYSIKFLLPAWTWHSCILKYTLDTSCIVFSRTLIVVFPFNFLPQPLNCLTYSSPSASCNILTSLQWSSTLLKWNLTNTLPLLLYLNILFQSVDKSSWFPSRYNEPQ